jgi:protein-L-isoaspartate(D-aspartate) O-methyltransferase
MCYIPGVVIRSPSSHQRVNDMLKNCLVYLLILLAPPYALPAEMSESSDARHARDRMVREQIEARGLSDHRVLDAMRSVPRHRFVPQDLAESAYSDHPLPIGDGQTISQPYVVALMTDVLQLKPSDRVLEIGTGSGYQAAVLSGLAAEVFTIEIKQKLYLNASNIIKMLGYNNITCRHGDGYFGWSEVAPFDAIMITAAVDHIPPPLLKQLRDGGRMVLPLGSPFGYQNLVLATKHGEDVSVRQITGVLFVPMTGHALQKGRP